MLQGQSKGIHTSVRHVPSNANLSSPMDLDPDVNLKVEGIGSKESELVVELKTQPMNEKYESKSNWIFWGEH